MGCWALLISTIPAFICVQHNLIISSVRASLFTTAKDTRMHLCRITVLMMILEITHIGATGHEKVSQSNNERRKRLICFWTVLYQYYYQSLNVYNLHLCHMKWILLLDYERRCCLISYSYRSFPAKFPESECWDGIWNKHFNSSWRNTRKHVVQWHDARTCKVPTSFRFGYHQGGRLFIL